MTSCQRDENVTICTPGSSESKIIEKGFILRSAVLLVLLRCDAERAPLVPLLLLPIRIVDENSLAQFTRAMSAPSCSGGSISRCGPQSLLLRRTQGGTHASAMWSSQECSPKQDAKADNHR